MKKRTLLLLILCLLAIIVIIIVLYSNSGLTEKKVYKLNHTELRKLKKEIPLTIHRYEKALFSLNYSDMDSLSQGVKKLSSQFPEILIEKDVYKDTLMLKQLFYYLNDPIIQEIYQSTIQYYPNLDDLKEELSSALAYYRHYYPEAEIPIFYTLVPGIDTEMPSVFGYDNQIFINLDLYLGENNSHYKKMGIPNYIVERCDKKYIAIDCFKKALIYKHLPEKKTLTLLDNLLYEGKKLYFTQLMFPERNEQDIIGYTLTKYEWAEKYQPDVWNYLIKKELLFSNSSDIIRKFIEEAPFTKPFTNASPGRLGAFIGWKIIQGYMKNNSNVSLDELMKNTDSQYILKNSSYKPLKK